MYLKLNHCWYCSYKENTHTLSVVDLAINHSCYYQCHRYAKAHRYEQRDYYTVTFLPNIFKQLKLHFEEVLYMILCANELPRKVVQSLSKL
jgi:hypothetical protein